MTTIQNRGVLQQHERDGEEHNQGGDVEVTGATIVAIIAMMMMMVQTTK